MAALAATRNFFFTGRNQLEVRGSIPVAAKLVQLADDQFSAGIWAGIGAGFVLLGLEQLLLLGGDGWGLGRKPAGSHSRRGAPSPLEKTIAATYPDC
jgi:hypothetical protein